MPWLAVLAASVTPVDAATGSITGYILGFGPLGIFALTMAYLLFRGWRLLSPAAVTAERIAARDEGRTDLLKELDRALADKHQAEEQRDDALRVARDQFVPLLVQFNATVAALLPLLQEMVSRREGHDRGNGRQ